MDSMAYKVAPTDNKIKVNAIYQIPKKEDFAVYSDHIFYSFILSFIIRAQFFICKLQFLRYFRNLSSIVYIIYPDEIPLPMLRHKDKILGDIYVQIAFYMHVPGYR